MANPPTLLILAGDASAPEVMGQVVRIIDWLATSAIWPLTWNYDLVGGAAYDKPPARSLQ